jgi:glycosyltransferase involved in cell wall biosynthesis
VPLGLDLSEHVAAARPGLLRRHLGLADDVPLVGTAGRLVPIKDHATLLHAVATVPDVHLAVIGDGELRAELQALTTTLGLDDRVHFVGWWLDMPAALVDLDVALLSSRNEGTPVALIEAAACAIPAVATDVGGVRAVVEDGVTGLLVPPARPDELAAALGRLLADPARRRRMGEGARDRVSRYAGERLVADLRAIYDALGARR